MTTTHRWASAGAALVVIVACASVIALVLRPPSPMQHLRHHEHRVTVISYELTSDGVSSSEIINENRKVGTTAWRLSPPIRGEFISGFANLTGASEGDDVVLYVTTNAPSFIVEAYRMGYYHGDGARRVWTSAATTGRVQPKCLFTSGINMVACDNWSSSVTMAVTSQFVPGDYLLKLVGSRGQQSYIPLIISNPSSHATYLVIARSLTEEGWNTYGGFDYYTGEGPCPQGSSSYPVCNRARIVSFDRPYAPGRGASDFLGNEYPFVYFAEKHGLDVTYVTDVQLSEDPSLMLGHRVLVSLGHDETWTYQERLGAARAMADGENLFLFGAATSVRHSRLQSSPLGRDREEVDYRDALADPLDATGPSMDVTGNTWSTPPAEWPASDMTGESYAGYVNGTESFPAVVSDASSWVFAGTGLANGDAIPGVISSDFDRSTGDARPGGIYDVLMHSPLPAGLVTSDAPRWGGVTYADTVYWTNPRSGAGVFDSGTVRWIYDMNVCSSRTYCPEKYLQRITGNILRVFGQGPAGRTGPVRTGPYVKTLRDCSVNRCTVVVGSHQRRALQ